MITLQQYMDRLDELLTVARKAGAEEYSGTEASYEKALSEMYAVRARFVEDFAGGVL